MKLYDQHGSWGREISREELTKIASSLQTEKDDFTVEIYLKSRQHSVNFEISMSEEPDKLVVYVYLGSSIKPEIHSVKTEDIQHFISETSQHYDSD